MNTRRDVGQSSEAWYHWKELKQLSNGLDAYAFQVGNEMYYKALNNMIVLQTLHRLPHGSKDHERDNRAMCKRIYSTYLESQRA